MVQVLKVEWVSLFELFLSDLDEKKTSAGYKRSKIALCNSARNLFKNVACWIFTGKTKIQPNTAYP